MPHPWPTNAKHLREQRKHKRRRAFISNSRLNSRELLIKALLRLCLRCSRKCFAFVGHWWGISNKHDYFYSFLKTNVHSSRILSRCWMYACRCICFFESCLYFCVLQLFFGPCKRFLLILLPIRVGYDRYAFPREALLFCLLYNRWPRICYLHAHRNKSDL